MKRMISLAMVVSVMVLGAGMLFAEPVNTKPLMQAAPSYFFGQVFYGPTGVQQLPAIITGTATNGQAQASFGFAFKAAPFVMLQWKETQTASGGTNECWATSVTTTNFVPNTTMGVGGAYTNFNWMAIGLLN